MYKFEHFCHGHYCVFMKQALSLDNASQMEKNKAAIRYAISKVQREPGDTGSPEAQS